MYFFTDAGMAVGAVVSAAMFCTIVLAKSIGCTLPIIAKTIKLDPAMASPIITTVVDAASLTILFTLATVVIGH